MRGAKFPDCAFSETGRFVLVNSSSRVEKHVFDVERPNDVAPGEIGASGPITPFRQRSLISSLRAA